MNEVKKEWIPVFTGMTNNRDGNDIEKPDSSHSKTVSIASASPYKGLYVWGRNV
jgi:hypothetical protein